MLHSLNKQAFKPKRLVMKSLLSFLINQPKAKTSETGDCQKN